MAGGSRALNGATAYLLRRMNARDGEWDPGCTRQSKGGGVSLYLPLYLPSASRALF
jgi:hypothetical protein